MIVPLMAAKYLMAAQQIISSEPKLSNAKEVQGRRVREVIDPDGNYVQVNQEDIPRDSVGIIRCVGPMYRYGSWYSWGSDELVAMAREFDEHPNVLGQVWQDDSGGGTISSVPPYLEFLRTKQKPVVSLLDICGSANYYKNCGTDHIMAENNISAMFGSIGVMFQLYDFSKMLEEMGIVEHIINSEHSGDKNKSFELALKGKYKEIRKEYLNPAAIRFQEYVKAMRPNLNLEKEGIITGKMFYAEEALEDNMIDSIGNLETAIDMVKFLAAARSFITFN